MPNPSILWVHADPGTGKTVLAAHVVSKLQELKLECAHYYFHVGSKAASSLGDFLRTMAFQMALSNAAIRDVLLQAQTYGSTFDPDDATTIWNKIFVKGIFQVSSILGDTYSDAHSPSWLVLGIVVNASRC